MADHDEGATGLDGGSEWGELAGFDIGPRAFGSHGPGMRVACGVAVAGKCFAQGRVPVSSMAATSAATIAATSSGSDPKARTPMAVLDGLVSTSASGAKSRLKPISRR